jgi:glycosyltransferase involved in cell wall biosynthesis
MSDRGDRPQVIHVATRYLRGGSEARIQDIVSALPEADHHLVVGIDSDVELARERLAPASLTVVRPLVREPNPPSDVSAFLRLVSLFRRMPHHLLVTHQSKAGILGRAAERWVGGAAVVHSLSMASFGPGYPRWQDYLFRTLEARLARITDGYTVVGADLARRYTRIGVSPHKFHVVRSDAGLFRPEAVDRSDARATSGVPPERPIVLYLGSLEPRKNVLDLVDLLARLVRTCSPQRRPFLVIAGQGPLEDPLQEALRRRDLAGDCALLGFVERPASLVAAADALVLLSRVEGLPQVLVQAAAAGTPFVSYEVDGARELLDLGAAGAVVPADDLPAATDALTRILSTSRPAATVDLSSWSPDAIADGYRRVLHPLVGTSGGRAGGATAAGSPPAAG